MSKADFDRAMPEEFWREVVDRVAREVPGTLLLAEAFWLMEGYFVRTLGMHRVYNSAFMNMMRDEDNAKYRSVIKNTIEFDPDILKRYVNFMSNPDERTAIDQFGNGDKCFGVATMMSTLPGLPMFGHGQIEGFTEKYGMEFRRARYQEDPDLGLVARHDREIAPLLHQRWLFAESENFLLYDFYRSDGSVDENVFAYSNRRGEHRALIIYHNRFATTYGTIHQSASLCRQGRRPSAPADAGRRIWPAQRWQPLSCLPRCHHRTGTSGAGVEDRLPGLLARAAGLQLPRLSRLARAKAGWGLPHSVEATVLTFSTECAHDHATRLRGLGVELIQLVPSAAPRALRPAIALPRTFKALSRVRPDVVYAWLEEEGHEPPRTGLCLCHGHIRPGFVSSRAKPTIVYQMQHLWDGLRNRVSSLREVYYDFGRAQFGLVCLATFGLLLWEYTRDKRWNPLKGAASCRSSALGYWWLAGPGRRDDH